MRLHPALCLAMLLVAPLALAQAEQHDHHGAPAERLGTVAFPVSCNAGAQARFPRAVALLHSFWYEVAENEFREIARIDPRCGMAWWGAAMSNYHQVWPSPYSPAELARGVAAAAKASAVGARTKRERLYIDAMAAFYRNPGKVDLVTRARAYEAAMETLVSAFPDDDEAAIFYGLALVAHGMSLPADKTYAYQKRAAELFNRLLVKYPDHPGIAHYLIHSFDYPALAPLALNAANAYAKIAPSAPHALHMPSHIFVRLGMWPETIASNLESARAAREYAAREFPGATSRDALHAYDYLTYAYLQRGEDEKVRALVAEVSKTTALDVENFAGYYAIAAIPARYALERGHWNDAAALTVQPTDFPWGRYAYAEAVTHFARGLGAARGSQLAQARADVRRLVELQEQLRREKSPYWADQLEVGRLAVEGWIARAESRNDEAEKLLRSAADLEDAMDKSPVTPGSILPAREMLGDLLLDLGRPKDALEAYERTLRDSPRRLNAISGAARAALLTRDRDKARSYAREMASLLE